MVEWESFKETEKKDIKVLYKMGFGDEKMKKIEKLMSELEIKNDVLSYTWRLKPTPHLCVFLGANGHCKLCNEEQLQYNFDGKISSVDLLLYLLSLPIIARPIIRI
jgi:hypothetical protein